VRGGVSAALVQHRRRHRAEPGPGGARPGAVGSGLPFRLLLDPGQRMGWKQPLTISVACEFSDKTYQSCQGKNFKVRDVKSYSPWIGARCEGLVNEKGTPINLLGIALPLSFAIEIYVPKGVIWYY
jgi:hypothetical protein